MACGWTMEAQLEVALRRAVREALGVEVARIAPLPAQLGRRRFARLFLAGGRPATAIARIEAPEDPGGRPPEVPPEPRLEPLRSLLERHGLPVPARYGGDGRLDLLEDLGDRSLRQAGRSASPTSRRALYRAACALVPRLQAIADPGGIEAFRRRLDEAHFRYKAQLFTRWSLSVRGRPATAREAAVVGEAYEMIAREAGRAPQRLAHRDFQSANLHVARDDPAAAAPPKLAMIDFQGAWMAPPEYDLVCLLRDSYLELPEEEANERLEEIRPRLPDALDSTSFARRFDLLTLTRKGKDHARFLYAAREAGDRRFLCFVPATVRYLRAAARRTATRDPRFAALAELIEALPESPCAG